MALPWSTVQKIGIGVSILGFLVAILGGVGELLGWWNDIGELMVSTGTIVGAIAGTFTLFEQANQDSVEAVHDAVRDNGQQLSKLDKLETLDDVQYELDRQTGVLEEIRRALEQSAQGSPESTPEGSEGVRIRDRM